MERWTPAIIRHEAVYCCPYCGSQSRDAPDARYCSNCGWEIDNTHRNFFDDFYYNREKHEYELVNKDGDKETADTHEIGF